VEAGDEAASNFIATRLTSPTVKFHDMMKKMSLKTFRAMAVRGKRRLLDVHKFAKQLDPTSVVVPSAAELFRLPLPGSGTLCPST